MLCCSVAVSGAVSCSDGGGTSGGPDIAFGEEVRIDDCAGREQRGGDADGGSHDLREALDTSVAELRGDDAVDVPEAPTCPDDADCAGLACGPDPVCGEPCGSCGGAETCQEGKCVPVSCWPNCGDEIEIPAGAFWMGCNLAVEAFPGCQGDEFPYHEVILDGFMIDRTEVTQGAYMECLEAGVCTTPKEQWDPVGTPQLPVVGVDWYQAEKYCKWAGRRLPTEAEWEKAARGPDGRMFPWGNAPQTCDLAIYSSCPGKTYEPCSNSPAGDSPYGLCDMAGNVMEWVADWYDADYYEVSPLENPTGPEDSSNKVVRDNSYAYVDVRVSRRTPVLPKKSDSDHGFRCARSVDL